MATYTGIKIYQLGISGATHAQGDTIVGVYDMNALDQAVRREIIELFSELAQDDCPPPTPARPLLPGRIGRKISARHGMNSKPLVA